MQIARMFNKYKSGQRETTFTWDTHVGGSSLIIRQLGTKLTTLMTCKDMLKHASTLILPTRQFEQLDKVSTLCVDDHQFKKEQLETVGDLPIVCAPIVLECPCLARIGRLDIFWTVNFWTDQ